MIYRYSMFLVFPLFLALPALSAQEAKTSSQKGKGYLGVQIQDVTGKIEKRFKLPSDEGAYVAEVIDDSPAEKAGVQEDDVILSFAGKAVYDAEDLTRFVQRSSPESKVEVTVWREGAKKTLSVTLGKKKERSVAFFSGSPGDSHNYVVWSGRASYGLEISTLGEQLGAYFGVPGNEGVLVESVKKDGPAAKAGFQAGDVITKVGKEQVSKNTDVLRELSDYEEGDKVDIEVYRKGAKKVLSLEIEENDEEGGLRYFFEDFGNRRGGVVAPRMRMQFAPEPNIEIKLRRLNEDVQRKLRESLEQVRENEVRIPRMAPVLERISGRITL